MKSVYKIFLILLLSSCVSNPAIKHVDELNNELGYVAASYSVVDDNGNVILKNYGSCLIRLRNIKSGDFESMLLNTADNIDVFNLDEGEYIITYIGLYNPTIGIFFPNSFRPSKHLYTIPSELITKIKIVSGKMTYLGRITLKSPSDENQSSEIHYLNDHDKIRLENKSSLELISLY